LIDTPIVLFLMNRDEMALRARVQQAEISISIITMAELLSAAHHSAHEEQNIKKVQAIFGLYKLIRCTKSTAIHYDRIKDRLYRAHQRLPSKNIWLAATAIEHNLTLITRDPQFAAVESLRHEAW